MNTLEFIKQRRFIVILRHVPKEYAAQAAKALYAGGVRIFEVTFDPSDPDTNRETAQTMETIRQTLGAGVSVGAGTVLDTGMAAAAKAAGAEFIVSPCTDPDVIAFTRANGMLSIPGAYTPTEIMNARKYGGDLIKVFPILPDGEGYFKNLIAPFSHIPFIVTGGITPETIEKFLRLSPVAVAAGASIINRDLCESGAFDRITELARLHTRVADQIGAYQ